MIADICKSILHSIAPALAQAMRKTCWTYDEEGDEEELYGFNKYNVDFEQ